jgi:hypothetical protein
MSSKLRSDSKPTVKVDRATEAARRAIGRLVQLLGDEDMDVIQAASQALAQLGGRAVVGPLAAALSRSACPNHRAMIVGVLATFAEKEKLRVFSALFSACKRERDLRVMGIIRATLLGLMMADQRSGQTPTPPTMRSQDQG